MAAKKLGFTFTFTVREVEDIEGVNVEINNLIDNLQLFKVRIASVLDDHGDRLTPLSGSGAPGSTPTDVQLFYLDTSAKDMYVSVGTASSSDWKKITP